MSKSLEWSYSALSTLRKCNRMYYFQYLAPTHHFTNPFRRKAFELKKSKSLLMWRGSVIDKVIEIELMPQIRQKQIIDFEKISETAVELAKRQFNFSERKLYKIKENTGTKVGADYCILDIHDANVPYTESDLTNVYSSIKEIIKAIPDIQMCDGKSMLIEYLNSASFIAPNLTGWGFEFENLKITPQLDLFMFVENKAVVLDWKVSESSVSDYSRQLVIGGITVFDTYRKKAAEGKAKKLSFSDIRLLEVNLFKQSVKEHLFNRQVADECIDYIYLNSNDVHLLTNGQSFDQLNIEDFPMTDKEGTCLFCKFRPLCSFLVTHNNQYDETAYNNSLSAQQFA